MRARLILGWLVVLTMVAAIGYAQEAPVKRLSLADALEIARQNNPSYLTYLNNRAPAASRSFNSAMSLFTPNVSVSAGQSWSQAGQQSVGSFVFKTPSAVASGWSLNFNYLLSGATIANRGLAAAQLRAADQDISGAATVLETSVKQEYINLLEVRAQADLAQHVVDRAQELLNLAQARYNVGQGTTIDVRRAQVDKGTADVGLLQARQNVDVEVLKLYQLLGVPAPEPPRVEPTDTFAVVEPAYNQDSLVTLALHENPTLRAMRAREVAAAWTTRSAYSTYLPSLQLSAGYGRFSQTANDTTQKGTNPPWNLRLGISLPLFDAFQRNTQISQARADQSNQQQAIRAQELLVRANVSAAYLALMTAYRTIGVQANNRSAADEALSLEEERYRVGSGSIIDLLTARVASEQAGVTYVNAVYDYHKSIAALEAAVGQSLR